MKRISQLPVREADVQRQVIDALRKMGKFVLRLNSGKVRVRGGFMQLCPTGTPDVVVIEPFYSDVWEGKDLSRVTWLELKRPKGGQSGEQQDFQREAIRRGERYFLIRTLDDALKIWR